MCQSTLVVMVFSGNSIYSKPLGLFFIWCLYNSYYDEYILQVNIGGIHLHPLMTSHNIDHVHPLTTRVRHTDHITKKRDTNHMTDHLTDTNDCIRNTKLNHMTLMSGNPGNLRWQSYFLFKKLQYLNFSKKKDYSPSSKHKSKHRTRKHRRKHSSDSNN